MGFGKPRAFLPFPNNPFYPGSEYEKKYAIRNLEKSTAILDKLGLDRKDSEGYRLRADNSDRLVITLSVASQSLIDFEGIAELLVNHWRDVGIYIHLSVEGETLYGMRGSNNEHQLSMWLAGGSENPWTYPIMTIPVDGGAFAPLNSQWYMT